MAEIEGEMMEMKAVAVMLYLRKHLRVFKTNIWQRHHGYTLTQEKPLKSAWHRLSSQSYLLLLC